MPLIELPRHLTDHRSGRFALLRRFANEMAAFYGQPVYLSGSALREDNPEPRDWDVRVTLPDEEFAIRYGGVPHAHLCAGDLCRQWQTEGRTGEYTELRWRWADDCVKRTLRGAQYTGLNVDFQVYPASHADPLYGWKPRARLDTRPDPAPAPPTTPAESLQIRVVVNPQSGLPAVGSHLRRRPTAWIGSLEVSDRLFAFRLLAPQRF